MAPSAYQMSIMAPRAPYSRIPSDPSAGSPPEAFQDFSVPQGDPQPRHRVPRHSLRSWAHLMKTKFWNKDSRLYILLTKPFLRLLGTAAFIASILETLDSYERKGNFSKHQKTLFSGITTALILGLGLNLFEGFKELAKIFRWKLWAIGGHTKPEAELILEFESLLAVCKLTRKSRHKGRRMILLFCIISLAINLGAQVSTAIIGFTFEVNDGKSYNDTYIYPTNGKVLATKLTGYFNGDTSLSDEPAQGLDQGPAHSLGEQFQNRASCGPYDDIATILNSKYDPPYFCRRTLGQQEFAYRFKEYNPDDKEENYPYFTNRIITVSSGTCLKFNVLNNETTITTQCIGLPGFNYTLHNATHTSTFCIPISSDGWFATIYIYPGTKTPALDEDYSCGNRCKWIWAFRSLVPSVEVPGTLFKCPITVSEVSNTTSDEQQIPDAVARVAAASIALQGRWMGTVDNKIWQQYQFNPFNTPWEVHGLPDEQASANMAEFALRSLAKMAETNPIISLPGKVPQLGSKLTIHKTFCYSLLGFIMAMHLALCIGIALGTKSVVETVDSPEKIAKLLQDGDFVSKEHARLLRKSWPGYEMTETGSDGQGGGETVMAGAHPGQ